MCHAFCFILFYFFSAPPDLKLPLWNESVRQDKDIQSLCCVSLLHDRTQKKKDLKTVTFKKIPKYHTTITKVTFVSSQAGHDGITPVWGFFSSFFLIIIELLPEILTT